MAMTPQQTLALLRAMQGGAGALGQPPAPMAPQSPMFGKGGAQPMPGMEAMQAAQQPQATAASLLQPGTSDIGQRPAYGPQVAAAPPPAVTALTNPGGMTGDYGGGDYDPTVKDQEEARDFADWADRVGSAAKFALSPTLNTIGMAMDEHQAREAAANASGVPSSVSSLEGSVDGGPTGGGVGNPGGGGMGADPDGNPDGYANGGIVTRARMRGPNPKGKDDGWIKADVGEMVIPADKVRQMLAAAMRGYR